MLDADGDGYGDASPNNSAVTAGSDCDDTAASSYPGAPENPADGIDQDCDGFESCYEDDDLDGYGSATVVAGFDMDCQDFKEAAESGDCDDTDGDTHPGAAELDSPVACMTDVDGDDPPPMTDALETMPKNSSDLQMFGPAAGDKNESAKMREVSKLRDCLLQKIGLCGRSYGDRLGVVDHMPASLSGTRE